MTEGIDWIARAGAKPKGKRPAYFEDPAIDRTLSIVMALVADVSVLRERLDTVERLLDARGTISRADIERYAPDRAAGIERAEAIAAFIARIMRGVQQEVEALAGDEPPLEQVSRELRDS